MAEDYKTIDEYIALFDPETQSRLQALRAAIREAAPDAVEKISWRMPTFYQNGNLIHFAAFKNHVSIFPGAEGVEVFQDKLKDYKTSKGTIQFPNGKLLPLELVREITAFRVKENTSKKR